MPRNVSTTALQSMLAEQTGEAWLVILKIEHSNLPSPIKVVNNNENVSRSDGTYEAFPFDVQMPDDREDQTPQARLTIGNIDRSIIEELRKMATSPTITMSVILASSPDTVEAGPFAFQLKSISYDSMTIQARMGYDEEFLQEPHPNLTFTPTTTPALFNI